MPDKKNITVFVHSTGYHQVYINMAFYSRHGSRYFAMRRARKLADQFGLTEQKDFSPAIVDSEGHAAIGVAAYTAKGSRLIIRNGARADRD
jgi:hypothetical protein